MSPALNPHGARAHGDLRARAGLDRKSEFCILTGFLQHGWLCATLSPPDKMWGFRFGLGGSKADGSLSYQPRAKVESLGL